jgi:hypothetical protein
MSLMAYVRFWIFSEDLSRKIFLSMMSSGLLILTIMASAEAWAQTSRLKDTACGVNPSRTLFRNLKREEVALFFQNHVSKDQLRLAEFLSKYKLQLETFTFRKRSIGWVLKSRQVS